MKRSDRCILCDDKDRCNEYKRYHAKTPVLNDMGCHYFMVLCMVRYVLPNFQHKPSTDKSSGAQVGM